LENIEKLVFYKMVSQKEKIENYPLG